MIILHAMNTVIIPVFNRPEFLSICLELICKADRSNEFVYLFSVDTGFDRKCLEVIREFPLEKVVVKRKGTPYKLGKQSFNLLSAYYEACYLSDNKVMLIEDDIFIHPDFFNWHIGIHEKESNIFCSIGTENHNTHINTDNSDNGYYYGARTDYQSWGVMFDKEILSKYILPHAINEYYKNPIEYLEYKFKQSWLGKHFAEQDGLIRRVKYSLPELNVLFPCKPRAFHAGFYSYHRNMYKRLEGPIEEKKKKIREIISNEKLYKQYCENPDFYNDSRAIDLNYQFNYDTLTLKSF